MREVGVVESTNGNLAVVSVKRNTACGGSCASCSAKCHLKANQITVGNKIGAMPGDVVEIEMKTSTVLKSAFKVYILPLLLFFLGYFFVEYKTKSQLFSLIGGLIAFSITFIFLLIWDRLNKEKFTTTIIEIKEKRT